MTLSNVTIGGNLLVQGGGSNSVKLQNVRFTGKNPQIIVEKPESAGREQPRIELTGTRVPQMTVNTPVIVEATDGADSRIDQIHSARDGGHVRVKGSTHVQELLVDTKAEVSLDADSTAVVDSLVAEENSGLTLRADGGSVKSLSVLASAVITGEAAGAVEQVFAMAAVTVSAQTVRKVTIPEDVMPSYARTRTASTMRIPIRFSWT